MVVFGRGVNKKGEITTKEILEIVLGAAAVLVLIFLMYSLLVGSFDKDEETAKSYLKTLKREVGVAGGGAVGHFDVMAVGVDRVNFYLVYFGERVRVRVDDKNSFVSMGNHRNHMCVCYMKKDATEPDCSVCNNFDYPMVNGVNGEGGWFLGVADADWKIEKRGGVYEFFI